MSKPSILFINRTYPPVHGATGRILHDLAQAFVQDGWNVTVLTTGSKAEATQENGVHVIRIKAKTNPRTHIEYGLILLKLALKARSLQRHDIVTTMTDPPMAILAGAWACKKHGSHHIHWCQDLYPDLLPVLGKSIPERLYEQLQKHSQTAMLSCERIIVIGRCMAKKLTNQGIPPQKITFIPNWPDAELTTPEAQAPQDDKKPYKHAVPNNSNAYSKPHDEQLKAAPRFRVLYAGNIGLAHPMETILDAAEALQKDTPEIEFVFVGDGQGYDKLAAQRGRRQLENIRLLPHQPAYQLPTLMQSGDVHLISMADQAAGCLAPSKLYSAFAAHRPAIFIGPAASETAKTIQDFKAGHVLKQGDPKALTKALKRYLTDENAWFDHQKGAIKAAQISLPENSIKAWIKRARKIAAQT